MPDPTRSLRRAASALSLAAIVAVGAACGPAAPAAATAVPTPAPSARSAPSAPPSDAQGSPIAEATPAGSFVVPSLSASTPLVDILPAELGGVATQKLAISGDDLSALDASASMIFISVLAQLGSEGAAMTAAAATNDRGSIIAIRVAGKTAQEINDAMIAGRTLNATTTKDELDLGGKHVLKVTTTIAPLPFYMYGTGDVSFTVAGADESVVAEALSKLP